MPTVPQIQRYSSPQVSSQVGPSAQQAQLDVRGVDVSGLGRQAGETFVKTFNDFNTARVQSKTNDYNRLTNEYKAELEQYKGAGAAEKLPEIQAKYRKSVSELSDTLSNDFQKSMFRDYTDRDSVTTDAQMQKYVAVQAEAYADSNFTGGMALEQNKAVQDPYDNAVRSQSLLNQRALVMDTARRKGWSESETILRLQEAQSKTDLGVMNSLADMKDYRGARDYFNETKESMLPEYRNRAESIVKQSVLMGESQEMSDELISKGYSLGNGIEEIRKRTADNPELRQQALSAFKSTFSDREMARNEAARNNNIAIANMIDSGTKWKDIPPSRIAAMTTSERNALQSYANDKERGKSPVTDWTVWTELTQMASDPAQRDQFNALDPVKYRPYLADAQYQDLVNKQIGTRSGNDKVFKELDGVRSDSQIIDQTASEFGIRYDAKSKSSSQRYNSYRQAVDVQYEKFVQDNGRKPKNEELQSIVDNLLTKEKTSWFTPSRFGFEIPETEDFVVDADTIDDVPQSWINQIRKSDTFKNLPKDRQNNGAVLRIYKQIAGQRG